jgi:hypothetical protein
VLGSSSQLSGISRLFDTKFTQESSVKVFGGLGSSLQERSVSKLPSPSVPEVRVPILSGLDPFILFARSSADFGFSFAHTLFPIHECARSRVAPHLRTCQTREKYRSAKSLACARSHSLSHSLARDESPCYYTATCCTYARGRERELY